MKNSEIITIGDELLRGSQADTNSAWLGKFLNDRNIKVRKITTVGDESDPISREIRKSIDRNTDLLIITGGLGPTPDDKTLDALCKAVEMEPVLNQKALSHVKKRYSELVEKGVLNSKGLTQGQKKMAMLPKDSIPLKNPVGTAPGIYLHKKQTEIVCLPGIPEEMKATLKKNLDILKISERKLKKYSKTLKIKNTGESSLIPIIKKISKNYPNSEINTYPSESTDEFRVKVRLLGKSEKHLNKIEEDFQKLLEEIERAKIYRSEK